MGVHCCSPELVSSWCQLVSLNLYLGGLRHRHVFLQFEQKHKEPTSGL